MDRELSIELLTLMTDCDDIVRKCAGSYISYIAMRGICIIHHLESLDYSAHLWPTYHRYSYIV